MKAVIVEDELRSLKLLSRLITDFCPEVELTGEAQTVDEAYKVISKNKPDVVFLDVQLQGDNSFNLLSKFGDNIPFSIIFTTAFEHYAVQAIRYSAVDYIMKPIDLEELRMAIARVKKRIEQNKDIGKNLSVLMHNLRSANAGGQQIILSTLQGLHFVRLNEIIYCEADGPYTTFFMKDGSAITVSRSMKEYEETLPAELFYRSHNSFIINLAEVKRYVKGEGGSVMMSNNKVLDVSRSRKEQLLLKLSRDIF